MKLSIVIPTYNRKDSLRQTLDGLLHQSFPFADFEVIVVSDGCTDGTIEMLTEYQLLAPYNLRFVNQMNGGPSRARNRGVAEAIHETIVFLDDDVEPLPQFLCRHAEHHETDDRIAVLGPMCPDPARSLEEPAWIAWEHAMLQKIYDLFLPGGEYFGQPAGPHHFYSGNASVRRKWLIAVGGFDESFTRQEDVELAVRLQRMCGIKFVVDFDAQGLHRPQRSFEAWLRIPASYGVFDAQRICNGLLQRSDVEANLNKRNSATRLLTSVCIAFPTVLPGLVALLRPIIPRLYRSGAKSTTLAALSALYNVCYASSAFRALPTNKD